VVAKCHISKFRQGSWPPYFASDAYDLGLYIEPGLDLGICGLNYLTADKTPVLSAKTS